MSANLKPDLQQIKTAFENFRAGRTGKERLPESLWGQAIALLEHYPFRVVCRQLRLKSDYLRQRAAAAQQGRTEKFKLHHPTKKPTRKPTRKPRTKPQQDFLHLTARDFGALPSQTQLAPPPSACRLMIERTDGSRLQLTVPLDWALIEALRAGFLRG
jgi:hypothetical protein